MPSTPFAMEPVVTPVIAPEIDPARVSAIVAMAWQDNTPFEAIAEQFGLTEPQVIALMRTSLKTRSFRLWRTRVRGRKSKHLALHPKRPATLHSHTGGRAVDSTTSSDESSDALSAAPGDFPWPPSPLTRDSLR